jgi:hypothetical protein
MVSEMTTQVLQPASPSLKRKQHAEAKEAPSLKKARVDAAVQPLQPSPVLLQPLSDLIADLKPKYEVKILSVLSSTSINKRVDSILQHLGRFHAWDRSVLPGVVLLHARSSATNKLITVAEIVRRRVQESDQMWFQYNLMHETVLAKQADQQKPRQPEDVSAVENTFMPVDDKEEDDEDYFETMQADAAFETAVHGQPKAKKLGHTSIFLSRVPVTELASKPNVATQTNKEYINYLTQKRLGLV